MFSKRVDVPVRTMTAHVGHLAGTVRTGKRVKWLPIEGFKLVLTCNDKRYLADREHVANCFSYYVW